MSYPLIRACTEGLPLLLQCIYIQDKDGRYLHINDSLEGFGFRKVGAQPDSNCIFGTEWFTPPNIYGIYSTTGGACAWFTTIDGSCVSISRNYKFWQVSVIDTSRNDVYLAMVINNGHHFFNNELNSDGTFQRSTNITYKSRFQITEAVLKTEITDIKYDLDNAVIDTDVPPTIALRTMVKNDSDDTGSQTLAFSYAHCKTGTWSDTRGLTIGTQTSFKADVPLLVEGKVTL